MIHYCKILDDSQPGIPVALLCSMAPRNEHSHILHADFWHLDILGFSLLLLLARMVFEEVEKSTQLQQNLLCSRASLCSEFSGFPDWSARPEQDLLNDTQSPQLNQDYSSSTVSPWLPIHYSKLLRDLQLFEKGLDVAKQHSYRGISRVQAHILTCINREFGIAWFSGWLFFVVLLHFALEREEAC